MTVNDIYKSSMALNGYSTPETNLSDKSVLERFPQLINQILADLSLNQISSIDDEITAEGVLLESIIWGSAMLISLSMGDTAKNTAFTSAYNAKRAASLAKKESISDVLPSTGEI